MLYSFYHSQLNIWSICILFRYKVNHYSTNLRICYISITRVSAYSLSPHFTVFFVLLLSRWFPHVSFMSCLCSCLLSSVIISCCSKFFPAGIRNNNVTIFSCTHNSWLRQHFFFHYTLQEWGIGEQRWKNSTNQIEPFSLTDLLIPNFLDYSSKSIFWKWAQVHQTSIKPDDPTFFDIVLNHSTQPAKELILPNNYLTFIPYKKWSFTHGKRNFNQWKDEVQLWKKELQSMKRGASTNEKMNFNCEKSSFNQWKEELQSMKRGASIMKRGASINEKRSFNQWKDEFQLWKEELQSMERWISIVKRGALINEKRSFNHEKRSFNQWKDEFQLWKE